MLIVCYFLAIDRWLDVNSFYFPLTYWIIELLTLTPYGWCFVLIGNYAAELCSQLIMRLYAHTVYFQLFCCTLKCCISLILLLFDYRIDLCKHSRTICTVLNVILLGHTYNLYNLIMFLVLVFFFAAFYS